MRRKMRRMKMKRRRKKRRKRREKRERRKRRRMKKEGGRGRIEGRIMGPDGDRNYTGTPTESTNLYPLGSWSLNQQPKNIHRLYLGFSAHM